MSAVAMWTREGFLLCRERGLKKKKKIEQKNDHPKIYLKKFTTT